MTRVAYCPTCKCVVLEPEGSKCACGGLLDSAVARVEPGTRISANGRMLGIHRNLVEERRDQIQAREDRRQQFIARECDINPDAAVELAKSLLDYFEGERKIEGGGMP